MDTAFSAQLPIQQQQIIDSSLTNPSSSVETIAAAYASSLFGQGRTIWMNNPSQQVIFLWIHFDIVQANVLNRIMSLYRIVKMCED